jgi:predicted ATPase
LMPQSKNPSSIDLLWTIPSSFYQNDVAKIMDNPFYLHTERGLQSIFSLGKGAIRNLSDSLFNNLADIDQIARSFISNTVIEPLKITYKNDDGRGYIKKNNEKSFFTIYNAASGYKSAIPIVLAIKYYNEIRKKKKTFIIEEPELNLFPTVQYELVKFLAKNIEYHNAFLITTHSPYILTSLNNLMHAYRIGQKNKIKVGEIISKEFWINPNDISAYQILLNGKCENLIAEDGLMRAEKIDHVSNLINNEYDQILGIKYGK